MANLAAMFIIAALVAMLSTIVKTETPITGDSQVPTVNDILAETARNNNPLLK